MRYSLANEWLPVAGAWVALAVFSSGVLAQNSLLGSPADALEAPTPVELSHPTRTILAPEVTPEERGDSLMVHQRYQAAIDAYRQAPQDSPAVLNKMGIAHQMMFNLQEASRCYRESLALNPDNSHVLNNLGTVFESQKRYSEAEKMYRKAIRLAPRSALAYKNLGTALLAQQNFKKGWAAYQTALSLDPQIFGDHTSPTVQDPSSAQGRGAMNYYMARGCVRAGMNDCAINYLRRALNEGFASEKKITDDAEFARLREMPAFRELLAAQKQQ